MAMDDSGDIGEGGSHGKGCTEWPEHMLSTQEALRQPFPNASMFSGLSYNFPVDRILSLFSYEHAVF